MIVARPKEWSEVLRQLQGRQNVAVVGCTYCATVCGFGGEAQVEQARQRLGQAGIKVAACHMMDPCCVGTSVNRGLRELGRQGQYDVLLSLACGDGTQALARRAGVPVFPGNDTLFIGEVHEDGLMEEVCQACGECRLGQTAGICPTARCPKRLLHGPCGGAEEGKCEVDPQLPCAWVLIYEALENRGELHTLLEAGGLRDHRRGHRLIPGPAGTGSGEVER